MVLWHTRLIRPWCGVSDFFSCTASSLYAGVAVRYLEYLYANCVDMRQAHCLVICWERFEILYSYEGFETRCILCCFFCDFVRRLLWLRQSLIWMM